MKYCENCKVSVRGNGEFCPLCQHTLIGEGSEEVYPKLPTLFHQHALFFKLLIFITAAAGIICVAINLLLPQSGYWSVFVILGILCFWISFSSTIKKRRNIPRTITTQVILTSIFCIFWDIITGWHGWSLDYVIPIVSGIAMLSLAVLAKIKRMPVNDYIVYFILTIILGILPLIFYLTGMLHIFIPSIICIALSLLSLLSLLLFEGKNMRLELRKRLHL